MLQGARRQKWLVIFTGLRFKSGYVSGWAGFHPVWEILDESKRSIETITNRNAGSTACASCSGPVGSFWCLVRVHWPCLPRLGFRDGTESLVACNAWMQHRRGPSCLWRGGFATWVLMHETTHKVSFASWSISCQIASKSSLAFS